jgi:hypothetical protein
MSLLSPVRKRPHFIVITVTTVILPLPMGFLDDGPNPKPSSSSPHRHADRHLENGLDKRITRRGDGRDDDDGLLWLCSNPELKMWKVGEYVLRGRVQEIIPDGFDDRGPLLF